MRSVCSHVQLCAARTLPRSEAENTEMLDSYKQADGIASHTKTHTHTDIRWSTESLAECQAEKNTSQHQTSFFCPSPVLDLTNKEEPKQQGGRESHPSTFCPPRPRRRHSQYVMLVASGDSQAAQYGWVGSEHIMWCPEHLSALQLDSVLGSYVLFVCALIKNIEIRKNSNAEPTWWEFRHRGDASLLSTLNTGAHI